MANVRSHTLKEFVRLHRNALDTISFVMFLVGFVNIFIPLLVYSLISHQFGWGFSYGATDDHG